MARKTRKAAAKRGKKSKVKNTRVAKKKAKPARARKKAKRKAKPKTLGQRISSGYRAVVDTVTGTDKLRNKMEQPGTSESE
jgi:hypothetical protein